MSQGHSGWATVCPGYWVCKSVSCECVFGGKVEVDLRLKIVCVSICSAVSRIVRVILCLYVSVCEDKTTDGKRQREYNGREHFEKSTSEYLSE